MHGFTFIVYGSIIFPSLWVLLALLALSWPFMLMAIVFSLPFV
ncbi:hypothetical protein [Gracilibacillus alcaliphilus]|nr:hypothetical protein [Gracilibacillus alcaliphilus]MBM7679314.1 hypothetical protein [Gracilibacillus alcaliphilus]